MKFNGMEVKVSRKFYGHEGETCYQGSIYCDGKKVGTWSDDAWCGPRLIELKDRTKLDAHNERIKAFLLGAGLTKAPADKDAVLFEETDMGNGDYLDSFIELSIVEKKGFRVSPTASAKKSASDGVVSAALVSVKYDMHPSFFSLDISSYRQVCLVKPIRTKDVNELVYKTFLDDDAKGHGSFVIREDGTAQTEKEFYRELAEL